jgi:hypothetical protein
MRAYREAIRTIHDPLLRSFVLLGSLTIAGVTVIGSVAILAAAAVRIWGH